MIRDPSDGSVRDKDVLIIDEAHHIGRNLMGKPQTAEVLSPSTSGLPITKAKAAYLARLAKSHEWLKDYFKPKENT